MAFVSAQVAARAASESPPGWSGWVQAWPCLAQRWNQPWRPQVPWKLSALGLGPADGWQLSAVVSACRNSSSAKQLRLPPPSQRGAAGSEHQVARQTGCHVATHSGNAVHSVHAVEREPSDKEFVITEFKTCALCLCETERIEGLAGKLPSDSSAFHCLLDATAVTALPAHRPAVMAANKAERERRTLCGGVQL